MNEVQRKPNLACSLQCRHIDSAFELNFGVWIADYVPVGVSMRNCFFEVFFLVRLGIGSQGDHELGKSRRLAFLCSSYALARKDLLELDQVNSIKL